MVLTEGVLLKSSLDFDRGVELVLFCEAAVALRYDGMPLEEVDRMELVEVVRMFERP